MGHSPSSRKESDTTERLSSAQQILIVYRGRGNCLLIEIDMAFSDTGVTLWEDGQALVEHTHEHICDENGDKFWPFLGGTPGGSVSRWGPGDRSRAEPPVACPTPLDALCGGSPSLPCVPRGCERAHPGGAAGVVAGLREGA